MGTFIFVYSRKYEIKVLSHLEATEVHETLIGMGYKHVATLDPCRYLEHLHNECDNIAKEVKLLGKIKNEY